MTLIIPREGFSLSFFKSSTLKYKCLREEFKSRALTLVARA